MARIRIVKRSDILYNVTVILLITGIVFLSYRLVSNNMLHKDIREQQQAAESPPYTKTSDSKDFFSEIWTQICQMDFMDPAAILSSHMPYLTAAHAGANTPGAPTFAADNNTENIMEDQNTTDQSRDLASRQEVQRIDSNEAGSHESYNEHDGSGEELSNEIKIQINAISDTLPPVSLTGEGPQILIYHTHSLEAYRQDANNQYDAIAAFRSSDYNHTVVSVGDVLAQNLEQKGIPVVHDRTNHEQYSWKDGLYPRSLDTIKKNMEKYDSLKIFLDIHRNYDESLKDPDKEVVVIDGKRAAKFFVLVGTGEGVSGGFADKPNWRENYKFALKITNKANEKYPGIAGDIKVQTGRYNQHVSTNAVIIEVGNHLTTLEEAQRTAAYLAEVISEIIER